jgi:hypothetical protein
MVEFIWPVSPTRQSLNQLCQHITTVFKRPEMAHLTTASALRDRNGRVFDSSKPPRQCCRVIRPPSSAAAGFPLEDTWKLTRF